MISKSQLGQVDLLVGMNVHLIHVCSFPVSSDHAVTTVRVIGEIGNAIRIFLVEFAILPRHVIKRLESVVWRWL